MNRTDAAAAAAFPATMLATPQRGVTVATWLYGAAVAAALGHFLLGLPIQLTEAFGNMLKLDRSWGELLAAEFSQPAYLRPLLFAQLKAVYDAARGDYFLWFRGVHVAQIALLVALYLYLVRTSTWRDAAALPLGLAVLVGMHTFTGTIREAFPINAFLTIVLCCLAAAALVLSEHRAWKDVVAPLLLAVAALTVESGLLVGVIVIAGALVGGRGVSRVGVGVTIGFLAGYVVLRFVVLDIGSPGLTERSSGFGFRVLDTSELVARFGDNPLPFYVYNVAASMLSVLLAEPRDGVFRFIASLSDDVRPAAVASIIAAATSTAAIARFVWVRRRAWVARRFDHHDRLVCLFLAVLPANALLSFGYTKDVIMSPAGAFYALAACVAFRSMLLGSSGVAAGVLMAVWCATASAAWAVRSAAAHMDLRQAAFEVRNEWAYADQWFEENRTDLSSPAAQRLLAILRDDAILVHPSPPPLPAAWWPLLEVGE
ncbi:MAG TPA: hypothetical protein VNK41_01830 [Vicinamibacterales bacterium]|nr:hypothetical protein [Vicinamibacterales bacterium]